MEWGGGCMVPNNYYCSIHWNITSRVQLVSGQGWFHFSQSERGNSKHKFTLIKSCAPHAQEWTGWGGEPGRTSATTPPASANGGWLAPGTLSVYSFGIIETENWHVMAKMGECCAALDGTEENSLRTVGGIWFYPWLCSSMTCQIPSWYSNVVANTQSLPSTIHQDMQREWGIRGWRCSLWLTRCKLRFDSSLPCSWSTSSFSPCSLFRHMCLEIVWKMTRQPYKFYRAWLWIFFNFRHDWFCTRNGSNKGVNLVRVALNKGNFFPIWSFIYKSSVYQFPFLEGIIIIVLLTYLNSVLVKLILIYISQRIFLHFSYYHFTKFQ